MDNQTLVMILVAGAVALVGYFICMVFLGKSQEKRMRNRLSGEGANTPSIVQKPVSALNMDKAKGMFHKIGQAVAQPFMPETREGQSAQRKRLGYAGIYAANAPSLLKGTMVISTVVFAGLGYPVGIYITMPVLGIAVGALIGYLVPTMWLRFATKKHQKSLEHALPDALDLMVVCVEAGLAIDAAMQRVGEELTLAHPRLSRELSIVHMETRVGLSRSEALKNLGARTGASCLQSLASLLIQADRFGTSIAGALRTHGEGLRMQRQFRAEELAAQASVKMTFPLVLFIFPATFIVLMGPTVIQMMESPLFK